MHNPSPPKVGSSVAAGGRPIRYSLEALIGQCDPAAPVSDADREWLEAKPVGNELL